MGLPGWPVLCVFINLLIYGKDGLMVMNILISSSLPFSSCFIVLVKLLLTEAKGFFLSL